LTLEDGIEGLSQNDTLATLDCGRMGGIFVIDIESSLERRSISPTLKAESLQMLYLVLWWHLARVVLYNTI